MSRTEDPALVLASLPGWQGAGYRVLDGGSNNCAYLVESEDGLQAVLKIDPEPRKAPFATRVEESRLQTAAHGAGLAPRVIHADETTLVTEYEDGTVWTAATFAEDDRLVELARALRGLHGLPLSGRSFDAARAARMYAAASPDADPVIVSRCVEIVESMQLPRNLCCCHNDLVASNILSTPDVKFIDWEYACDNDPFFDLATVVAHHELTTRQAELLLEAYFDGDGRRWRDQLVRQERLYDALHWLWLAARGGGGSVSADVYARLD